MRCADIVVKHVDTAQLVDRMTDQTSRAGGVGEIDHHRGHAIDPFERLHVACACHDLGALGGQLANDRHADSLARSGNDCDLVGQFEVHRSHTTAAGVAEDATPPRRRAYSRDT